MRDKGMVALGRVVLAKRERVIMLEPWEKGLVGMTLHYPYEVRDAKEYFDEIPDIKIAPDMLKLAEHILETKEGDFDPSQFVDHYEEAVVEMLKKEAGRYSSAEGTRRTTTSERREPHGCPPPQCRRGEADIRTGEEGPKAD